MSMKTGLLAGAMFGVLTIAVALSYLKPLHEEYVDNKSTILEMNRKIKVVQDQNDVISMKYNKMVKSLEEKDQLLARNQEQVNRCGGELERVGDMNSLVRDKSDSRMKELLLCRSKNKTLALKIRKKMLTIAMMTKKESDFANYFYDLERRDDRILKCAMELIDGFMALAALEKAETKDKTAENLRIAEMISLSNRLEYDKMKRAGFVRKVRNMSGKEVSSDAMVAK